MKKKEILKKNWNGKKLKLGKNKTTYGKKMYLYFNNIVP